MNGPDILRRAFKYLIPSAFLKMIYNPARDQEVSLPRTDTNSTLNRKKSDRLTDCRKLQHRIHETRAAKTGI